ncbi:hypothetical protein [Flavihumibacter profundi]|uniref:hypothetical protein n=1 Tax=Flavihumibacter profundi TaxID=2716883 RepID=UPI001CC6B5F5|nr:hypothetical protein [Flavihumibacter profundi]MBZ5858564.1 hypothetical protein [Flavihumibacter profundi]
MAWPFGLHAQIADSSVRQVLGYSSISNALADTGIEESSKVNIRQTAKYNQYLLRLEHNHLKQLTGPNSNVSPQSMPKAATPGETDSKIAIRQALVMKDSLDKQSIAQLPAGYLSEIIQRTSQLEGKIDASTEKVLPQFQKQQEKIRKKLAKVNPEAARKIFDNTEQRYKDLTNALNSPDKLTHYIPYLDTLKTSLKFLDKQKVLFNAPKGQDGLGTELLGGTMDKVTNLEQQFQKAELVKQYMREQQLVLTQQLQNFGFARQLKHLNKEAYYYSQQINDYKESLKDPKKIERKAINILSQTKLFQDFMHKNSMLASLFRMPSDGQEDMPNLEGFSGLQTRSQVNQIIQSQIGAGGPDAMKQLQANGQHAQDMLQQLKNKVNEFGAGANDGIMPNFKPNNQKKKSFLKRLEYGTNIQTQRPNVAGPVISEIGLSTGYKINDKGVLGIGASYKMGWGQDIQHVRISHQGAGLRSFLDYKLKKTVWLSGGFEMNYLSMFSSIEQLNAMHAWQQSGLLGLSKKLPMASKLFKNTKVQVLWDFLSSYQVPKAQPILFRIGYSF